MNKAFQSKDKARGGVPQIGFDRFIQQEWAVTALRVRAGLVDLVELIALLDEANLGREARKKTRTVLNRLWLEPRADLVDFSERGADISKAVPGVAVGALCWGMAIAAYPFFGKAAELVGRLSALQGDCGVAEIHRRMSEVYGEREGTRRMTNVVIQTQASWGVIERIENGRRLVRLTTTTINNDALIAWLAESALRYTGKPIGIASVQTHPVLFPFTFKGSLPYVLSTSPNLQVDSQGLGNQFVSLPCST